MDEEIYVLTKAILLNLIVLLAQYLIMLIFWNYLLVKFVGFPTLNFWQLILVHFFVSLNNNPYGFKVVEVEENEDDRA